MKRMALTQYDPDKGADQPGVFDHCGFAVFEKRLGDRWHTMQAGDWICEIEGNRYLLKGSKMAVLVNRFLEG
jgi:hypothetical protein